MKTTSHSVIITSCLSIAVILIFALAIITIPHNIPVYTKAPNELIVVDSNNTGYSSSIAIGVDKMPVISYLDYGINGSLKVAHCGNIDCSKNNTITSVIPSVGANSMTIGKDGLPDIAYGDGGDLKMIKCGNSYCSAGNSIAIIDTGPSPESTSIAIGADDSPIISYDSEVLNPTNHLQVAKCGNPSCSVGNIITVLDKDAYSNSITIGTDGLPIISYSGNGLNSLKVLKCGNSSCSAGNIMTTVYSLPPDYQGQQNPSITIGNDGLPVMSSNVLKVIHCNDASCKTNVLTWVNVNGTGPDSSIAIGTDGFPIISYSDLSDGHLKVVHCGDASCSSNNVVSTIDSTGSDPEHEARITIGSDGLPIISYWDRTNGYLKVAHCGSITC